MKTVPGEALILVSVLPEPRDLEIARLLGWYRIPLKTAPKVIDVDFLAFYQTGAFGEEHRWKIEYFCPVRGHELVTRAELFNDEPDHRRAHEEYYKLSLGPLEKVRNSITAESWKRITFLYTLGELFNKAATIGELVVRSENRQILWRSLREHLPTEQRTENDEDAPVFDDPAMLEAFMLWMELPKKKKNNLYGNEL